MSIPNTQQGFTLIELVLVIVLVGILAAVAIPRFVDLTEEADTAALSGVAGSLSSGSAINYAAFKAGSNDYSNVNNCQDTSGLLEGGLPTDYTIDSLAVSQDDSATCTLNSPEGNTDNFTAIGTD